MPRYHRVEDIIHFALALQAPGRGLCLEDVQQRFGVGRRTAERMREAVDRLYPGMTSHKDADGRKYWRLSVGEANGLMSWQPEELGILDELLEEAERERRDDRVRLLRAMRDKVQALSHPSTDPDAAATTACDAHQERLRRAIVLDRQVVLTHREWDGSKVRSRVHPYGILAGARPRLVAFHPDAERDRIHPLDEVDGVELLEMDFERQPVLDMRRFAANAFAPYEDGPIDVAWRFSGEHVKDVLGYEFHPDQDLRHESDGSLEVRFRADGLVEMSWHMFGWGDRVETLEAPVVKNRFISMLRLAREAHPGDTTGVPADYVIPTFPILDD